MRCEGFLCALAVLVSLMLLMVIMSQREVTKRLNKNDDKVTAEGERLYNELQSEVQTKADLEKVFEQGQKAVDELQATLTELSRQLETRRPEHDACQTEMKTKTDELDLLQKEHAQTQAALQAESDAWNKEITTLKEQAASYREICDYVRKDSPALKLCGTKPNKT